METNQILNYNNEQNNEIPSNLFTNNDMEMPMTKMLNNIVHHFKDEIKSERQKKDSEIKDRHNKARYAIQQEINKVKLAKTEIEDLKAKTRQANLKYLSCKIKFNKNCDLADKQIVKCHELIKLNTISTISDKDKIKECQQLIESEKKILHNKKHEESIILQDEINIFEKRKTKN